MKSRAEKYKPRMQTGLTRTLICAALMQLSLTVHAQLQPFAPSTASNLHAERIYLVKPGDSLQSIAQQLLKHGGSWQALRDLNGIASSSQNLIVPGQRLRVPATWIEPPPLQQVAAKLQSRGADLQLQLPAGVSGADLLPQGSVLRTSSQPARFVLEDGSSVQMAPRTELVLESLGKEGVSGQLRTVLRLVTGSLQTVVTKLTQPHPDRLKIATATATIGVRGTSFRATVMPDAAVSSEVLDGRAQLDALGTSVPLPAGFGSKASSGQKPLDAVPLLPASAGFTRLPMQEIKPTTATTTARFEWQAVPEAERYEIAIAHDEHFEQLIHTASSATALAQFEQVPRGYIFIRVRAYDRHGLGGYDLTQALRM
jgi:hypothetical protein